MTDDLGNFRNQIDEIDAGILDLLKRRYRTVEEIGHFKKTHGIDVTDDNREGEIFARIREKCENLGVPEKHVDALIEVWDKIIENSRNIQT